MTREFDLAGFTDSAGRLGRRLPTGTIHKPKKVWIRDGFLHWEYTGPTREVVPSREMLNRFLQLNDDGSIERFASEWGVLAVQRETPPEDWLYYLPGRANFPNFASEPLEAWRYYSNRARAVLNVAAALEQGKLGDFADWAQFAFFISAETKGPDHPTDPKEAVRFGLSYRNWSGWGSKDNVLEKAREVVAEEVQGWMDCWKQRQGGLSDFKLEWQPDAGRWELQLDYHGLLFPAIAWQLALVVGNADSLFVCSGCSSPYIRPRDRKKPKKDWGNYCERCTAEGIAAARASSAHRQRVADAKRMYAAGQSISKIAKELERKPSQIKSWVERGK